MPLPPWTLGRCRRRDGMGGHGACGDIIQRTIACRGEWSGRGWVSFRLASEVGDVVSLQ